MDMINYFIFLFVVAIINTIVASMDIKKFLAANPSIQTVQNLENFKQLARRQMYQALVQIVILAAAMIMGLYGIISDKISLSIVILLNLALIGISLISKKFEEKARSLKVHDKNLEDEYDSICQAWVKKPLPNF